MKTFLDSVILRNEYKVYESEDGYICESTKDQGDSYVHTIPDAVVEKAASILPGRQWAARDAELALKLTALQDGWKYTYGQKFHWLVQDVLVVLVATNRATMEWKGKKSCMT